MIKYEPKNALQLEQMSKLQRFGYESRLCTVTIQFLCLHVWTLNKKQNIRIEDPGSYHVHAGSSSTYPNFSFGWINVKDVALAHILAYEVPSANGRYCMVERVVHYSELVQIIREMYPNIPLPDK